MYSDHLYTTLVELIHLPSTSGHEENIRAYLAQYLSSLGLSSQVDGSGNLVAALPGEGTPLLLNAHMDRVPPGLGHQPMLRDGILYSDGSTNLGADDAAGIVIILEVVRRTLEQQLPQQSTNDEHDEKLGDDGRLTIHTIDQSSLRRKTESPIRNRTETPTTDQKRTRTPSNKSISRQSSSTRKMSAQAKEKFVGNVISGLIIDGSDEEEEDFFSQTPVKSTVKKETKAEIPFWSRIGMGIHSPLRMTNHSPLTMRRSRSVKSVDDDMTTSESVKTADDDDDDVIILDSFDTNGKCGVVGYRCSKAFCFKCVA